MPATHCPGHSPILLHKMSRPFRDSVSVHSGKSDCCRRRPGLPVDVSVKMNTRRKFVWIINAFQALEHTKAEMARREPLICHQMPKAHICSLHATGQPARIVGQLAGHKHSWVLEFSKSMMNENGPEHEVQVFNKMHPSYLCLSEIFCSQKLNDDRDEQKVLWGIYPISCACGHRLRSEHEVEAHICSSWPV